jgi:hypothetical protein
MESYWVYAIILAVVIIGALSFYAGKLLRQLKKQQQLQQQAELARHQAHALHDGKVLDSVLIITRAMKEEQCDFSEGCWRLSVLLSSLKMSSELALQFPAIFKLYDSIKHLSILDGRKGLTKSQRMKEDYQRMTLEAELHSKIVQELDLLQQYTVERMSILKA